MSKETKSNQNNNVNNIDNNNDNIDNNNEGLNNDSGSDNNADNNANQESNNTDDGNAGAGEKTFTQKEVSAMMAREKKQGRNSAYNELGIDPKDKKTMAIIKAVIDSQKAEEDNDSSSENDELLRRTEIAEAKAEAMLSGVKKEFVEDAVTLVMSKKAEESDLKTLFSELKTKYPVWFDSKDDDDNKGVGSKGTGSSLGSRSDNNNSTPKSLGARLAAQRKGQSKQSSYWSK